MIDDSQPLTHRQPARDDSVGVRGCLELILKLIIGLIIIGTILNQWLRQGELGIFALIIAIILILLLIWLIIRQRHFCRPTCLLTDPGGCVHGDPNLLANHILEPIVGTAAGLGFSHYELELLYEGAQVPDGIIYADGGGNPDTSLTQGNNAVNNGTLGFVDIKKAVDHAGIALLINTAFQVRLHVVCRSRQRSSCVIGFELSAAGCFIKKVGVAWSHDYVAENEPLKESAPGTPPPADATLDLASIGGSVYVRGAARSDGCTNEKLERVRVWSIPDDTFSFAQPANGTPSPTPPGGSLVSEVEFVNDDQRDHNRLDGLSSEGNILTYVAGWFTRTEWQLVDVNLLVPHVVPDIREKFWVEGTGKYTLLLEVLDTAGNTYYDVQRVWVDNDQPHAQISQIGGLAPCQDLNLSDFVGATCTIEGIAWDPVIRDAEPPNRPNFNFDRYELGFQKNGAGSGSIPITPPQDPNVPVPNAWPGPPAAGTLAEWDIVAALDGGASPAPHQLARGERCAYVLTLGVWDRTLVGEGGIHHHTPALYAVNIINDL